MIQAFLKNTLGTALLFSVSLFPQVAPKVQQPEVKPAVAKKAPHSSEKVKPTPSIVPIFPTATPAITYVIIEPTYVPVSPAKDISVPTGAPQPTPGVQSAIVTGYDDVYKQAGDKYGVPWQVLYGLHLTETGLRDGEIYNGAGSGAQGPMQFMPQTWAAYGVDGNGDGVVDINNAADAIHGAANFLARHSNLAAGLYSYGGNTSGTLKAACERGYCM